MRTNIKRGQLVSPRSKEDAVARCKQLRHEIDDITRQLEDTSRIADRLRHPTVEAYEAWAEKADAKRREFRKELRLTEAWLAGWTAHERANADAITGMLEFLQALRADDAIEPEEMGLVERFEALFRPNQPCPRCRAVDPGRKSGLCVTCSGMGQ